MPHILARQREKESTCYPNRLIKQLNEDVKLAFINSCPPGERLSSADPLAPNYALIIASYGQQTENVQCVVDCSSTSFSWYHNRQNDIPRWFDH